MIDHTKNDPLATHNSDVHLSSNDNEVGRQESFPAEVVEGSSVIQELKFKPTQNPILVVSESWPSVAFALDTLGCRHVTVLVPTFLASLSNSLHLTQPWLSLDEFPPTTQDHIWDYGWIVGSSEAFLKTVKSRFARNVKCWNCISNCTNRRERGLVLSHTRIGGITQGRWKLALSVKNSGSLPPKWNFSPVQRKLHHILRTTEKGISVASPTPSRKRKRSEEYTVTGDSRINTGVTYIPVIAKCVLNNSGWVKRLLTRQELCEAYDLQVDVIKKLMQHDTIDDILQYIVKSPAEKAAHCAIQNWLTLIHQAHDFDLERSAAMLPAATCTESLTTVDNKSKPLDTSTRKIHWYKPEDEEALLNDEKAARADDALTDTGQWDHYIVNEYRECDEWMDLGNANPDLKSLSVKMIGKQSPHVSSDSRHHSQPLVCCGGKVTQQHVRLFMCLRKMLVRRSRRNIMQSFLKYLRIRYGKLWPSKLTSLRQDDKQYRAKVRSRDDERKRFRDKRKFAEMAPKPKPTPLSEVDQDLLIDVRVALDGITRVNLTEISNDEPWWDWDHGSTIFFWRWHDAVLTPARDGFPVWKVEHFTPYRKKQQWPDILTHKEKMTKKLVKVVRRGYISTGPVSSLTGFFAVPKGDTDIRMVYDATKCGLNETIWSPTFLLPTIDTTLRQVGINGWMSDIDLGEMFLNFPLNNKVRKYVGVDLTEIKAALEEAGISLPSSGGKDSARLFLRWERCLMGLRCSPYLAVKYFALASEIIKGNREDTSNVFHVKEVILNLPGMSNYDPSKPKVYGVNTNNEIAANFEVYIDDIRICGPSLRSCVKAARQIASRANYLGIQDAPRKRRFPSRTPGVWSGAKSISTTDGLYTSTTQVKWDKAKGILEDWKSALNTEEGLIHRKQMERGRGFLVHLSRTYPSMVPYLKGVHHVLEGWRVGRDKDGWKFTTDEWKDFLADIYEVKSWKKDSVDWKVLKQDFAVEQQKALPEFVCGKAVKRFGGDLDSLLQIMSTAKPPLRLVRGVKNLTLLYGFGDASGGGFGSSWEDGIGGIKVRFGVWNDEDNKGRSSNYRELRNLVESVEEMGKNGELEGAEVYFFTDNSTAERAYYKGSSSNKLLHDMVFRLRRLELDRGCKLTLCHVAGTRMIAQGSDGLSRGNMSEGVMQGKSMLSFVPLHLTASQRQPNLVKWIKTWAEINEDGLSLEVLTPKDWFNRGHDFMGGVKNIDGFWLPRIKPGLFLWEPPPAAAEIALEQLRKARLKRNDSVHIVVCPRLLEPIWRSHLHKSADLICEIPAKHNYWKEGNHEPLILALFFPYLEHRPWTLKRSPSILDLEEHLRQMWKSGEESQWTLLRELRIKAWSFSSLQASVVFKMLRSSKELGLSHRRR